MVGGGGGLDGGFVAVPAGGETFELAGADFLSGGVGDGGADGFGARGPDPGGEAVCGAFMDSHAAIAAVGEAEAGGVVLDAQVVGIAGVERVFAMDGDFAFWGGNASGVDC